MSKLSNIGSRFGNVVFRLSAPIPSIVWTFPSAFSLDIIPSAKRYITLGWLAGTFWPYEPQYRRVQDC